METSPAPAMSALARITVVAPRMRLDVAVPADVPLAALIPTLLWHTGEQVVEAGAAHGGWALQRLGEAPLDTSRTCASLGVLDGDVVYFRPRADAAPELVFDDPVDGVGTVLRERGTRWSPRTTRRCSLVTGALLPQLGLLPLLNVGPSHVLPAVAAGITALLLLLAAAALSRAAGDSLAGAFAGFAALPYAAAAGLLAPLGDHPLRAAGVPELAIGGAAGFAAAVLAAAAVGVAAPAGGQRPPGGAALLAGALPAAVIGLTALAAARWDAAGCAALASAFTLALTVLIPRIAYRSAGLPPAAVALNAADLRAQSNPLPAGAIAGRALTADHIVTALVAGSAIAVAACVTFALRAPGVTPPILAAVTVVLLALRARLFGGAAQRWWLIGAALLIALPTAQTVAARWPSGGVGIGVVLGVLLIATAVVGQIALRPERRFAPTLARWADLLELLGVLAVVPLALLILGTFGYFRSLGG